MKLKYEDLKIQLGSKKIVVQAETGAGGENTYLIESQEELEKIKEDKVNYCVSKYTKNLPLNITLIIGNSDIILLPISVQLILLTEKKFKYVGADFIKVQKLNKELVDKINDYSIKIASQIRDMGYRGIIGIDYILCEDNEVLFMEINPRFQSSTFLISQYLNKYCGVNVAKLHFLAMESKRIENVYLESINNSFINCNKQQIFENIKNFDIIENGYFDKNKTSFYRKIFNRSIIDEDLFEKID